MFDGCGQVLSCAPEKTASEAQAEWGRLGDFRRKVFLIGLGLGGLLHRLDLLFHWLEGGSENGGGQLGNVPAITDSGFKPLP
jgi:hypothetical protein